MNVLIRENIAQQTVKFAGLCFIFLFMKSQIIFKLSPMIVYMHVHFDTSCHMIAVTRAKLVLIDSDRN